MAMDKKEVMEQLAAEIAETNLSGEKDFINNMMAEVNIPPVKVPEPVFRELFLPYLIGEKSPSQDDDTLNHWMGLVDGASTPVDIIGTTGEVLFKVPPLYDTSVLSTDRHGASFAEIFRTYSEEALLHQGLGRNYLVDQLAHKVVSTIPNEENRPKNAWAPILEYYGLNGKSRSLSGSAFQKPGGSPTVYGDDDLEFNDD